MLADHSPCGCHLFAWQPWAKPSSGAVVTGEQRHLRSCFYNPLLTRSCASLGCQNAFVNRRLSHMYLYLPTAIRAVTDFRFFLLLSDSQLLNRDMLPLSVRNTTQQRPAPHPLFLLVISKDVTFHCVLFYAGNTNSLPLLCSKSTVILHAGWQSKCLYHSLKWMSTGLWLLGSSED